MSSKISNISNNNSNNNNSIDIGSSDNLHGEWVEIVEPKTRQRIYANLETGVCAIEPPEGALVSKSEDFSNHWWELYDQKTGKHYYYNPEQQRTVWTKPRESSTTYGTNGKRTHLGKLLIIPVSKLQTFRKGTTTDEQKQGKCDASTQTIASNLVSVGTQTISETTLEKEFNDRLRTLDLSNESTNNSSSCTHSSKKNVSTIRSFLNHRQVSDFNGRDKNIYQKNQFQKFTNQNSLQRLRSQDSTISESNTKSSHHGPSLESQIGSIDSGDNYISYFGPKPSAVRKERAFPISINSPSRLSYNNRPDDYMSSTSTFGKPATNSNIPDHHNNQIVQKSQTNNLSHYLVREARAMGIALISDDEVEDDDQEISDDEDDDIHDDLSSQRDELNVSQDFGEDSSEGWKSFSDQESPNGLPPKSAKSIPRSPIHCETTTSSFKFNDAINDDEHPTTSQSQQLDHRKLVENFKKSRQSSSFGLHDSLGRSYKSDANQAVQKIKAVADNYFHLDKDSQASEKQLRQLSTLSTLPRPHKKTKDKLALSKPDDTDPNADADYDVVEENCGYFSDSEHNQLNGSLDNSGTSKTSNLISQSTRPGFPGDTSDRQMLNSNFDRNKSSRGSTFSVESFARENLSRHPKKGGLLFNRKVKLSRMISWTKNSIKQPMISSVTSDLNSHSISSFKLIQQYMGDRKVPINKRFRQILAQSGIGEDQLQTNRTKVLGRTNSINNHGNNPSTNNNSPHIPDRLKDELAYDLVVVGCSNSSLRDEIYIQMARQLTENPSQESVRLGMVLLSILLCYFSPSSKFSPFLLSFLDTHPHQMARDVCLPRLHKRLRQSYLTYCRKPADGKEISIVRLSITKWPQYCGVFGESLERLMTLQSCSPYLKTLRLPWILTTLGNKLLETGGAETEGIFRCAADHDLIAQLKLEIDCVDFRKITDEDQVHSLLSNVVDPHVIAGLLKLFFRQLYEPVFPTTLYELCLQNGHDGHMACRIFNERLQNVNKDVVAYLIRLLQTLSKPEKVTLTKMDNSNLSMVWAPNLLRAPEKDDLLQIDGGKSGSKWSISNGSTIDDGGNAAAVVASQSMIFEQTRQEMQFIRSLIINLDTSFIENVT